MRHVVYLGRDGGVGHGRGHRDEAVHAAKAHGDLEQLGHLLVENTTRKHEGNGEGTLAYVNKTFHDAKT